MKGIMIGSIAGLALSLAAMSAIAAPHGKGEARFDRFDSNGDGKITADEMNEKHAAWIEEADADGDGAVSKDEAKAFHKARLAEMREKRNPDKNGDGVIDRDEYMNAAAARFERMDKNGDGVIGEGEKRGRRRHHRGGD